MAPGSSNFLQWDAAKNNVLSDTDFASSTVRQQGIVSGIRIAAASNLHNKLYYQVSTMVAALAGMLANKGYVISDADIAVLTSQLSVIMTSADMGIYSTTAAMVAYVTSVLFPVGGITMWPGDSAGLYPPTGFLELNGVSLLRSSYLGLFGVIGTRFGALDGSHFTLPDLRGYFVRGWDHGAGRDPDKASRANRGDGTVGDYIGTFQGSQFASHIHACSFPANYQGTHDEMFGGYMGTGPPESTAYTVYPTIGYAGGNESRPINMNMMFIIKY